MGFIAKEGLYTPAGMFTLSHFVALFICLLLIATALYFTRNISDKVLRKITFFVAIFITVYEIVKIIFKLTINEEHISYLDGWVPLFYCSLFIFSTWMSSSKNTKLQNIGDAFITGGGIVGGLAFLICPATSLMIFPIYHLLSIHSLLYHSLMVYLGILYFIKGHFQLTKKHFINYSIFILIFMILAEVINIITLIHPIAIEGPANLMLLSKPFNLPFDFVNKFYEAVPYLYPIVAMLVYLFIPYGVSALIYIISKKFLNKKEETEVIENI